MSDVPLVSVCIPAYNHERYIGECLEALLDQFYPEMELLVINDGSKDKTWEVLNSFRARCEEHFRRVVFRTQENQGTCKAVNALFREARGDYIAICASDDKFLPGAIQTEADFLSTHPETGLVFGTNLIMDSDSRICYWDARQNIVYDKADAAHLSFTDFLIRLSKISPSSRAFGSYRKILRINHVGNGWMFRRALLEQIPPFTPEAPLEDHWFMMQVSKWARISFVPQDTFCYRWHAANTIKQTERMQAFARRTYLWERKYVKTLPCRKYYAIFMLWYARKIKRKMKKRYGLPGLLKYYKRFWCRDLQGYLHSWF